MDTNDPHPLPDELRHKFPDLRPIKNPSLLTAVNANRPPSTVRFNGLPPEPRHRVRAGVLPGVLALVVCLLGGCQTRPAPEVEASVRPGVNESYLKPDLSVAGSVERFEREGREVYDRRAEIVNAAGLQPGMRVADIGAGTGLFTFPFAEVVGPKGRVYAVDIAEPFVRHIEAQAQARGLKQVRGVLCNEREVGLKPNSIDFAFICDTYHHFEYPMSTLASLRQALRPGGEVLVVDFKRIPGQSSEWVLNHVRAGQETTEAEFAEAGFVKVGEELDLRDNYVVRFRSTKR